ncbi:MAG: glycosyltransferase [Candidatus Marinimicrobia bacterium]|nr:glycosyltransferase [Candidatus Neomarinimicrobiota bacterium]
MKILYISPENTVGTLNLWQKAHTARGNECRFITLYQARHDFDPGLCLDLPLVRANNIYLKGRHKYYQHYRGQLGDYAEQSGYPPQWQPNSWLEKYYFHFRDWLWHYTVEQVIENEQLLDYDIYHLEWGLEFYRDGRFVKRLKELGKSIACTYHGQDLRTRGVIPEIDAVSQLNLTSELDLLTKHPNMKYLFLPFDTGKFDPDFSVGEKIRICHSPTNRYYKGSETIIPACERISQKYDFVEFVLIENQPTDLVMEMKQSCDILVDQVHNRGGWGYGMNSVEALAMGLCCVTELVDEYVDFIPDHPFINITADSLEETLKKLVLDRLLLKESKVKAREWVIKYHDIHATTEKLYGFYQERGWAK